MADEDTFDGAYEEIDRLLRYRFHDGEASTLDLLKKLLDLETILLEVALMAHPSGMATLRDGTVVHLAPNPNYGRKAE